MLLRGTVLVIVLITILLIVIVIVIIVIIVIRLVIVVITSGASFRRGRSALCDIFRSPVNNSACQVPLCAVAA